MSNDPDLRVSRSLELLAALKETGAAFAKKEAQLASEIAARRHSAGRKYREAMEKIASSQTSRIAEIDARLKSEEARLKAIHESRAARIQRLESAGIRDLPKRAQEAKAKWMGDLQMKQFLAQRKQTSDLEAADSAFADFSAKLAAQRAILLRLERRARYFLSGYITYLRGLARKRKEAPEAVSDSGDRIQLFEDLKERLEKIEGHLRSFRELLLPRVFSYMPLPPLILVVIIGAVAFAWNLGATPASDAMAGLSAAAILAGLCAVHRAGLRQSHPAAAAITSALSEAHRIHDACSASSSARHVADRRKVEEEFAATSAAILEQWNRAGEIESEFEQAARKKIETQVPRLVRRHQAQLKPRLDRLSTEHSALLAAIQAEFGSRNSSLSSAHESEVAALADEERTRWTELQADWNASIAPLYDAVSRMNAVTELKFPPWDARFVDSWAPPTDFTSAARFGALDLDLAAVAEAIPRDPRLSLPGSSSLSIPLSLCFPDQGSLLFESNESCGPAVALVLNNIILRLLSTTPPGKISFTIIDPVGLGQNFAGLMHLSDYEESLINRRIWTQKDQIEERLADLSEHIEKVIQMYLRNEYATITEYNAQAGGVAEKYHFLILADFPANITETAARRLQSIAVSGPRCGIYPLIHWDQRQPLPEGIAPDELRKSCVCLRRVGKEFVLSKKQSESGAVLLFDSPPDPDLAAKLVHRIGKSSIDSNRVEVPFAQVAPKPSEFWTNETTNELKIAVGRTGATKLQYLAMGKGTRQHALFAGKTGSGKSTLFHVIITNLALACSPAEVEFYLVDFKKGVEFKCYAAQRLPHARVVAIESDREFGLSVLQRVDEELKRRGDRFRKLGVQDVAGYKKAGGAEPIPRCLLIIDEFQEFFIEDDSVAQAASVLLDRIVRQGRAFGIHVLLGSQTLGGAYSLARATLGQMVIRVALQCNEADAYLIMDDNNSAPRLLSRPGEGIYNDAAGAIEGNSPFQVVWLPDEERDQWLEKVHDIAVKKGVRESSPIVFEGNAPADIRENDLLRAVLDSEPVGPPAAARAWLGAPNSIKGPTEVVFQRQSGNHLLIVGQRDEAALTLLGVSLLALAAQYPPGAARFVLFDGSSPGSRDAEFLGCIIEAARQEVTLARGNELAGVMNEIAASMKARSAGDDAALTEGPLFLFIHGLQKFKKLRHEDDFDFSSSAAEEGPGPGARLNDFICEGSSLGMHLLVTIDTFNNVSRFMSRKALSEFEMRVVFQMGANDSSSLIDSPKASNLGLHRALFYNEHEGHLETFRPYAPPSPEWLRQTARKLSQLHA